MPGDNMCRGTQVWLAPANVDSDNYTGYTASRGGWFNINSNAQIDKVVGR